MVLVEDTVSLELLVEGEHCSLGLGLDVASAATPAKEDAGGWRGGSGWEGSRDSCGERRGAWETAVVACAAAAGVVVGAGVVDGGAFGDLERHCGYLVEVVVVVVVVVEGGGGRSLIYMPLVRYCGRKYRSLCKIWYCSSSSNSSEAE